MPELSEDSLKVYLFNVGAGDHIMIEFPDQSLGIIDSFFTTANLNLQEIPALTYLKYLKDKKNKLSDKSPINITFLCLSHADLDHVTGVQQLLEFIQKNNVNLENLWLFGIDIDEYSSDVNAFFNKLCKNTKGELKREINININNYIDNLKYIIDFRDYWRKKHKPVRTESYFWDFTEFQKYGTANFEAYSIGPIARIAKSYTSNTISTLIKILFERVNNLINSTEEFNNNEYTGRLNRNIISSILEIIWQDYKLFFGGDAPNDVMLASLEDIPNRAKKNILNPDFVKASHHGASSSTSKEIWELLLKDPNKNLFVGISAGRRHHHPHPNLYKDITEYCQKREVDAYIYRTNECADCKNNKRQYKNVEEINLDFWFKYHGCKFEDSRVELAFQKYSPSPGQSENLVGYIFEFLNGKSNNDIKVYRGTSKVIGTYDKCVYASKCKLFCT